MKIQNLLIKYRPEIEKTNFYILLLLVFAMPFFKIIIPKIIALWLFMWLLQVNFKNNFSKRINKPLFYLLVLFFLFHLIALFYSLNKTAGLFDIEVKLSLIIFPAIFLISGDIYIKKYIVILKTFFLGNLIAVLTCFIYAIIKWYKLPENFNDFYYESFSVFIHPSYFAMYISFSLLIVIYFLKNRIHGNNFLFGLYIFSIPFFLYTTYLLSSRAGVISCIFVLLLSLFLFLKSKGNVILKIGLSVITVLFVAYNIKYNGRIITAINQLKTTQFTIKDEKLKSDNDRLKIWLSSFDIIKNNFLLGVGNGDTKDELNVVYKKNNLKDAFKNNLNAHNQFIETFIALGFIGFSMLMAILIIPLINAIKKRNILLLAFIVIIIINFMFESMLNTQAGVVFFAFFYSLLNFANKEESTEKTI